MVFSNSEFVKLNYRKNKGDARYVAAEKVFLLILGKMTLIPDWNPEHPGKQKGIAVTWYSQRNSHEFIQARGRQDKMKRNGLPQSTSLRRLPGTPKWADEQTLGERMTKTPHNSCFVFSLAGPFFFFACSRDSILFSDNSSLWESSVCVCLCARLKPGLRRQGYAWWWLQLTWPQFHFL